MACPTCGSTERRSVAPGYWECLGTIEEVRQAPQPGGPPGALVGYIDERPCLTRYQEASTGLLHGSQTVCECGMFAVARCTECARPLCGDCSRRVDGRIYCAPHGRALQAEIDAERASALARAQEAHRQQQAERAARRDQVRAYVPGLLEQLKTLGSPGSTPITFMTSEDKPGVLASMREWVSGSRPTVDVATTLNAWPLKTYQVKRSPWNSSDYWEDVVAFVSDEGHFFIACRGKPEMDNIYGTATETLRQWADPERQSASSPFGDHHGDRSAVTWEHVEKTLRDHLPPPRPRHVSPEA